MTPPEPGGPSMGPLVDRRVTAALCAVIAFALGQAVQMANGNLAPAALGWLTASVIATGAAFALPPLRRWESPVAGLLAAACVLFLAVQFSQLFTSPPAVYIRYAAGWHLPFFQPLAFAAVVAGALVLPSGRARYLLLFALLAAHLLLGLWLIRVSPAPYIDVFVFQRDSAIALADGVNPYGITFPNIYRTATFYGPGLVTGNRLNFGYPYPPLTLLLTSLAHVFAGDVRYAQLLAMTATGGLLGYLRPGPLGALAAAIYLFTPRTFFVLEQSWTEPFVVLALTLAVFCAAHRPRWFGYALGAFIGIKQYAVLAAPLALLLVPRPWTMAALRPLVLRAGAVVAAIWVPFLLLDPGAFVRSVVTLQFHQPFRAEALSYLAWIAGPEGAPPSSALFAFVAALAVLAVALWRAPRTPSGFALGVAAMFLAFFALNKQAFCNYYYFVIGAACVALAAADPSTPERAASSAPSGEGPR